VVGASATDTHQFDPARSVTFNRFGIGHARTADLK
jgi:hypothetical protein